MIQFFVKNKFAIMLGLLIIALLVALFVPNNWSAVKSLCWGFALGVALLRARMYRKKRQQTINNQP